MKRIHLTPRPGWQSLVEKDGLTWHSEQGRESWNERNAYLLTPLEVQKLSQAASELAAIFHQTAGHVVKNKLWSLLGLREHEARLITASWERGDWSLHGRFDFLLDADGTPKLLEYNAETALSLVETAVVQKHWLDEALPGFDQFNDLEALLIKAWRDAGVRQVHCVWRPRHAEVEGTVRYMAMLIRKAGVQATLMALHRMGWDSRQRTFVDHDNVPISHCYKLYPWEWMLREPFARHVESSSCTFIEPPWRLLLGSKGILCLIAELFGDHPSVLACYPTPEKLGSSYVSKPLFGHEGHNVAIHQEGVVTESLPGEYGDEAQVFQAFVESPRQDGFLPQFGVWMVRDEPAAICIRETQSSIVSGQSALVPHAIEQANRKPASL